MPDFTIEIMQQCTDSVRYIGKYCQTGLNTEQPSCTCEGFQYRRSCKHLEQAMDAVCQYHESVHGKPMKDGVCPLCGKPTEYVKVAV